MGIREDIIGLRESIENTEESIGEALTQYHSECALFGDAGPGQHPSLWKPQAEAAIKADEAALAALLATPEGVALVAEERAARAAYQVELDAEYLAKYGEDKFADCPF